MTASNGRIGNPDQSTQFFISRLEGGRAEGTRIAHVSMPSGLDVTVVCDRAMDIYSVRYKGTNLNYITPVGICSPQYYDPNGAGWLRSFFAGFMTTCGLRNVGSPDSYKGEDFGLHGRISNTPAEDLSAERTALTAGSMLLLSGTMKEACPFGEAFSLKREYLFPDSTSEACFYFEDTVTNISYTSRPFMQLYHFNMGHPFLSERSVPLLRTENIVPRDAHAAENLSDYMKITPPVDEYAEMCYYHTLAADGSGTRSFGMKSPDTGLTLEVSYNDCTCSGECGKASALDIFVQWKMFCSGAYVMGFEPGNATLDGHEENIKNGTLKILAPGECAKRRFTVKITENN